MELFQDFQFQLEVLGQVALAMILGAFVGLDREMARKPAGLRTQMLVTGASAMLVRLSDAFIIHFDKTMADQFIQADPIRIMVAVVTGISFIGAGTIIRHQKENYVEGITTAASLLFSAVIGMSIGLGQYVLGIGATILTLITLIGLNNLRKKIKGTNHFEKKE